MEHWKRLDKITQGWKLFNHMFGVLFSLGVSKENAAFCEIRNPVHRNVKSQQKWNTETEFIEVAVKPKVFYNC